MSINPAARALLLATGLLPLASLGAAADIAGVKLEDRATIGASGLVLNGAGVKTRYAVRIYVAGFYFTEKSYSTAAVLALAGPKRISIVLLRNIPARKLVDALTAGIRDNCSPEEEEALESRMAALAAVLLRIQQGKSGDVITFDWLPGAGTLVALNGNHAGEAIEGADLYGALMKIWLGERPTSPGLKRALLGEAR
jgi:hypothetical protein